jgi:predicted outer membrane repeat protein
MLHIIVLVLFSAALVMSPVSAATIRVPADQPTIQAGIDAAVSGDSVVVAPGTYSGPGNRDLRIGIALTVLGEAGAKQTIIDVAGGAASLAGRGFHLQGAPAGTLIEGFTVENGDARGLNPAAGGGALVIISSPTFRRCIFSDNRAGNGLNRGGGAVACYGSSPTFEDCTFLRNSVAGIESLGGALAGYGNGTTQVLRGHFEENSVDSGSMAVAGGGAALFMDGPVVTFEDCTFLRNSSNSEGGGVVTTFFSTSTYRRCSFREQTAHSGAGSSLAGNVTVTECEFIENRAAFGGGGLESITANPRIERSRFIGNSAGSEGGAIRAVVTTLTVDRCLIVGNTAPLGGALMLFQADVQVVSSTIHGNSSGIQVGRPGDPVPSSLIMERSIVSGSTIGEAIRCAFPSWAAVTCSDLFGNQGGDWVDCVTTQGDLNGNQHSDPLYCVPESGDFRLGSGSPCAPENSPAGCGLVGAFEVGCGATALKPTTWGQVKAHYH